MQANPIVGTILKVVNALGKLSNQVNDGITNIIDTNASVYAEYMGKIDARIQGSDNSFNKISGEKLIKSFVLIILIFFI